MTWLRFWQRQRRDADLRRELDAYIEQETAEQVATGKSAAEARSAAVRKLGNVTRIREDVFERNSFVALETLWQDLRYGARSLVRARGFTAAALVTLALGIGANTAIFTVVDAVLLRPLPYPDPNRLVTIGDRTADGLSSTVGFTTVVDWRARNRSFEHLALMRLWAPTLVVDGEAEPLAAVRVSWNYFDVMGVRPALGRAFTTDDDRPDHWRVLLLSDALWRRRFGGEPLPSLTRSTSRTCPSRPPRTREQAGATAPTGRAPGRSASRGFLRSCKKEPRWRPE